MSETRYMRIMSGELKVDVYSGENCDEHRPYWYGYCVGDKDGDEIKGSIKLEIKDFPPGTKITIEVPCCPDCQESQETCSCGFNWREWVEGEYS